VRGYSLTDSATTDSFFVFTVGAHRVVLLASMGLFDTSRPGLLVTAYQGRLSFSVVDSDSLCLGLRTTFSWLLVSSHSPSSRLPCGSASTSRSQFRGSASAFSPVDGVSLLCLLFRGSTSGSFYSYTSYTPLLERNTFKDYRAGWVETLSDLARYRTPTCTSALPPSPASGRARWRIRYGSSRRACSFPPRTN
jgi:hypothetical protein